MRACSLGSGISGMNEWVSCSCMRNVKKINFTTRRNRHDTGCELPNSFPGREWIQETRLKVFVTITNFAGGETRDRPEQEKGFEVIFPVEELQRRHRIGWGHSPIFRSKRPGRRRAGSSVSGRFVAMMILT